jgi:hypothetical protein
MGRLWGFMLAAVALPGLAFGSAFVETAQGRYSAELNGAKIRLEKGRVTFGGIQMHFGGSARPVQPLPIGARTVPLSEYSDQPGKPGTRLIRFCERVRYIEIWAGVGLEFYIDRGRLQYEFLFDPGAPVESVALSFRGAEGMEVMPDGSLRVTGRDRNVFTNAPVSWVEHQHARSKVSTRYVAAGRRTVGLALETPDGKPAPRSPSSL